MALIAICAACAILVGCESMLTTKPDPADRFDEPVVGLDNGELGDFQDGHEQFRKAFSIQEGLGPVFNNVSCASCHSGDGRGLRENILTRFSRGTDLVPGEGGPQLQTKAIPGATPETIPAGVDVSYRLPPPVFGVGFLEALSESTILSHEDPGDADADGISGRANWVTPAPYVPADEPGGGTAPRVGRFGRKASVSSLLQQTVEAYHQDIGMTTPQRPQDNVNPLAPAPEGLDEAPDPEVAGNHVADVIQYMRMLAPPAPGEMTDRRRQGEALFTAARCNACHIPAMRTGPHEIEAIANHEIALYSDLLLHDLGDELADQRPDASADGREWRTAPLWGLRVARDFLAGDLLLLHDGRARSVDEAIRAHGGLAGRVPRHDGGGARSAPRFRGVAMISRVSRRARIGVATAFAVCALPLVAGPARGATSPNVVKPPATSGPETPYRGHGDAITYGGHGELRFGHDRQAGVSNPDWFSVGQAGGFVGARLHPRWRLALKGAYDRGQDDFTLEKAYVEFRTGGPLRFHAGVIPAPLGTTNLSHDAPSCEFGERSLVATELVGVPYSELGFGVAGRAAKGTFAYEVDVVTGYDDGIVMGGAGGTRVPSGRNNYGDQNGVPALAGRVAWSPGGGAELGVGAQSGRYNRTEIGGVTVDQARSAHLLVADGATSLAGFRVFSEAALALVDVAPGLEGLYAERQWGLSFEAGRTLFDPFLGGWKRSKLTAALRADAVDLDARAVGDSRARVTASLNLRHATHAVVRAGWYYEIRHDRFDNRTPFAGLTLTAASYF